MPDAVTAVSVIITVRNRAGFLRDTVQKLLKNHYGRKDITVVFDSERSPDIRRALGGLARKIRLLPCRVHGNIATALNQAVSRTSTDTLLFLETGVRLPEDPFFLHQLAEEMCSHDIAELPKEAIPDSIIARLVGLEYLGYAMTAFLVSQVSRRSPMLNGSAFAVRKGLFRKLGGFPVRAADPLGDFAAHAFRSRAKHSFHPALKVECRVPSTLQDWIEARRMWARSTVAEQTRNARSAMRDFLKSPGFVVSILPIVIPMSTGMITFFVLKQSQLSILLPILFMNLQFFNMIMGAFLWFSLYSLVTEGLLPSLAGLVLCTSIFVLFAKILRFRFNIAVFLLFYFVYAPAWFWVNIALWIWERIKRLWLRKAGRKAA